MFFAYFWQIFYNPKKFQIFLLLKQANTIANDISVVETATTIAFTTNARAIPLNGNTIGGGQNTVVSGKSKIPFSIPTNLLKLSKSPQQAGVELLNLEEHHQTNFNVLQR